jgi:hypothetical protein
MPFDYMLVLTLGVLAFGATSVLGVALTRM